MEGEPSSCTGCLHLKERLKIHRLVRFLAIERVLSDVWYTCVHERHGEVDGLLALVGDGQIGDGQIRFLKKIQVCVTLKSLFPFFSPARLQ